jgi:hypothetical protein
VLCREAGDLPINIRPSNVVSYAVLSRLKLLNVLGISVSLLQFVLALQSESKFPSSPPPSQSLSKCVTLFIWAKQQLWRQTNWHCYLTAVYYAAIKELKRRLLCGPCRGYILKISCCYDTDSVIGEIFMRVEGKPGKIFSSPAWRRVRIHPPLPCES